MGGADSKQSFYPNSRALQHNPESIQRLSNILKLQSDHQQAVVKTVWDSFQRKVQNNQMLKGMFKKLDPSVMKPIGSVCGEIQLSFKYDIHDQLLLIKVISCRELSNKDLRSKLADFFVRIEMIPDEYSQGYKLTQVSQQTNSPRFDEIFSFNMPEVALGDTKLVVQVCEHTLGGSDDVRGETIIELNTFSFHSEPTLTAWYPLNNGD